MKINKTLIDGLVLLEPKVFGDARGFFFEMWQQDLYKEAGLVDQFKQDNISRSSKGILRGMHFQNPHPQGKLVSVIQGSVFDVVVDLRKSSSTFGKWFGAEINDENHLQLYVPPGCAHGFLTLQDNTLFHYKCTDVYSPGAERCLFWNDPAINIQWPFKPTVLSEKDQNGSLLKDIPDEHLFQ